LVLHELWPLAGNRRVRVVEIVSFSPIWLIALLIMLNQLFRDFAPGPLFIAGVLSLLLAWLLYDSQPTPWPRAQRLNLAQLPTGPLALGAK
jgi:hypothetical protein